MDNDIQKIKDSVNIVDIISQEQEIKRVKNGEWVTQCCFHDDHEPSMTVSERKQFFFCFVCETGGDVFDWFTKRGLTFKQAKERISGKLDSGEIKYKKKETQKIEKEFKKAKEPTFEIPDLNHFSLGEPDLYHIYKYKSGSIATIIRRYNMDNGGKIYIPLSWLNDGTGDKYFSKQIPENRPVYNLDLINRHPDARIVIVEGEKCADYGQNFFPPKETIFTTWIGGAKAIHKTDFSILEGRQIIHIPDNDDAGKKAMAELPTDGEYVHIPKHRPKGFDIADGKFDRDKLENFIQKNLQNTPQSWKETKKIEQPEKKSPPPPDNTVPDIKEFDKSSKKHFEYLGTKIENKTTMFYFYVYRMKNVVEYRLQDLKSRLHLEQLMPRSLMEKHFPSRHGFDVFKVGSHLMNKSMEKIIEAETIRGVGAWMDDDQIVFFDGGHLYFGEEKTLSFDYASNHVYMPTNEKVKFDTKQIMTDKNAQKTWKFIERMKFSNIDQNKLLAGWMVISPFASVLRWRPHIWIIGESGRGKSWLTDNIIRRLGGGINIVTQGATTSAGLRNQISSTGRSVIMDEMDAENKRERERIDELIHLARLSSYSEGGSIFKANTSGGGYAFEIKSAFCFTSVNEQLQKQSDLNRFSVLSLDGSMKVDEFRKFEKKYLEFMTDEMVASFIARNFLNLPAILKNAEKISQELQNELSARESDQIGFLLSGWASYFKTGKLKDSEVKKLVADYKNDSVDEIAKKEMNDNIELLMTILSYQHKFHFGGVAEYTIGQILSIAVRDTDDEFVTVDMADKTLRNYGIKIVEKSKDFVIMNNSPRILREVLNNTTFGRNYHKVLRRIDGATAMENTYFVTGISGRGYRIPYEYLNRHKPTEPELPLEGSKPPIEPVEPVGDMFFDGEKIDDLPF